MRLSDCPSTSSSSTEHLSRRLKDTIKSLCSQKRQALEHYEIQQGETTKEEEYLHRIHNWVSMEEERNSEAQIAQKDSRGKRSNSELHGCKENLSNQVPGLTKRGRSQHQLIPDDQERTKLPFPEAKMVGEIFEQNTKAIMGWLSDPQALVIGVYGMGGVGKTALVTHLHNQFVQDTTNVYLITVSQTCSIYNLQKEIAKVVGLDLSDEESEMRRARLLYNRLRTMGKVMIFLDDLWHSFSVHEVGIPLGESCCRIVLTTRSLEVCRRMGCNRFILKKEILSNDEATELFIDELKSYDALTGEAKDIANKVVTECEGLPLAIVTIASRMTSVTEIHEWKTLLNELRNPTLGQHDLKNYVFPKLQSSYDRLSDKMAQNCFLSAMLYCKKKFPFSASVEALIDLWIDEGIFDRIKSRKEQINKGHTILKGLENECLLKSSEFPLVKVHSLIKYMAIQMTCENHPHFMIKVGSQLQEMAVEEMWTEDLVNVTVRDIEIEYLPYNLSPECPKLKVLRLSHSYSLKGLPDCFFVHMKALRFLDLSGTAIERLPESVSDLENLRALLLEKCSELTYVPSVAKLTKLRVLILPYNPSCLKAPKGMDKLKCLEKLGYCIWNISDLISFNQVIGSCHSLCNYVLHLFGPDFDTGDEYMDSIDELDKSVAIEDVELEREGDKILLPGNIEDLSMTRYNIEGLKSLGEVLPSLAKAKNLRFLTLIECGGLEYISSRAADQNWSICGQLNTLEVLIIEEMPELNGLIEPERVETEIVTTIPSSRQQPGAVAVFTRLWYLEIGGCPKLKVVFQVKQQHQPVLLNLESIFVYDCLELEEIIESERVETEIVTTIPSPLQQPGATTVAVFTNLKYLEIRGCPKLKVVFPVKQQPVLLNLEIIDVYDCSELEEIIESSPSLQANPILALPKLMTLKLQKLPKLGRIYRGLLLCTSLRYGFGIKIDDCPELKLVKFSTPALVCDASPPTLASIPKFTDNPQWWAPLYQQYHADAQLLSRLTF